MRLRWEAIWAPSTLGLGLGSRNETRRERREWVSKARSNTYLHRLDSSRLIIGVWPVARQPRSGVLLDQGARLSSSCHYTSVIGTTVFAEKHAYQQQVVYGEPRYGEVDGWASNQKDGRVNPVTRD